MYRLVAVVLLAGVALCAPIENFDDIPSQYKDLIPPEVADHLKSLTADDKKAIKAVALRYSEFKTEDEAMEALKKENEGTWEKAQKLHKFVQEKVDKLAPSAKEFVTEVLAATRKLHSQVISGVKPNLEELKGQAKSFIEKYQALPEEAKASFREHFPITAGLVKNDKFKAIAEGLLKVN
ncbi:unnamed protein product, partial [Mesorhabditis spiculigera]